MRFSTTPYPKPGEHGGRLIRSGIKTLRERAHLDLPLDAHILCACSGGPDSVALAVLLARYGRRLAAAKITLLHINHGWRGRESDADARWVGRLAQKLGTDFAPGVVINRAKPASSDILNALLSLGYSDKEATWAVKQLDQSLQVAEAIRQCLKLLSKA